MAACILNEPAIAAHPYDQEQAAREWRELVARCAAAEGVERLKARRAWRALVVDCAAAGLE